MSKQLHTTRPWEYSAAGAQVFANNGQTHVADVRGYGALQYEGEDAAVARMDADGALIAAAPDLLAALQSILEWTDTPSEQMPIERRELMIRNAARAAILKATHPKPKEQGATQ